MRHINRFIVISLGKFLIAVVVVFLGWFGGHFLSGLEDRNSIKPIVTGDSVDLDNRLLAARIISIEEQAGIATEPEKAKRILASLLQEARFIDPPATPTTASVRAYFGEIGQLLGRYFYYQRSTTFTEGLNTGVLDCDLRSFLYQTIASQAGLDVGVIYSPGHAFVGWQAEGNGVSVYWETTGRHGSVATMDRKMYKDSIDPLDYQIRSQSEIETIYSSWIFSEAFDRNADTQNLTKVLELTSQHPTWHYLQMIKLYNLFKKYGIHDQLTKEQMQVYLDLNTRDDFSKRMLMHHYQFKGENEKAMDIFNQIANDERVPEDFDLASQVSLSKFQWFKYRVASLIFGELNTAKKALFKAPMQWSEFSFLLVLISFLTIGLICWPYFFKALGIAKSSKVKA